MWLCPAGLMIGLLLFPRESIFQNLGTRFLFRGEGCDTLGVCTVVVYLFYASCAWLLEKGSFYKYKGYMCNYDFMQGPSCSYIWIGCAIIAFVEGVFAKCGVIITWQETFQISPRLKWNFIEKVKFPLNSNSLLCFQN